MTYLSTLLALRESLALRQYRHHRRRQDGIYNTSRFAAALYARAEWNALHRLAEAERRNQKERAA